MAGSLLILGAGYLGAAIASRALEAGDDVVLADNWFATERTQLSVLEPRGARVVTADLRDGDALRSLLVDEQPAKVVRESREVDPGRAPHRCGPVVHGRGAVSPTPRRWRSR